METWFLLFGGSSADGRGPGNYEGRTTDASVALKHFNKVQADPYSTGYVQVITDTESKRALYREELK